MSLYWYRADDRTAGLLSGEMIVLSVLHAQVAWSAVRPADLLFGEMVGLPVLHAQVGQLLDLLTCFCRDGWPPSSPCSGWSAVGPADLLFGEMVGLLVLHSQVGQLLGLLTCFLPRWLASQFSMLSLGSC
jgi:hypothetical protein